MRVIKGRRGHLLVALISTALAGIASFGCTEREQGPQTGVVLFEGLESFSSPAEIGVQLRGRGIAWDVVEQSDASPDGKRPRFSVLRWKARGLGTEEFEGDSELLFYNERLARVTFFPSDPGRYVDHLRSTTGASENQVAPLPHDRRGSFLIETPHGGSARVFYEDPRLIKEMNDWIEKYSIVLPRHAETV